MKARDREALSLAFAASVASDQLLIPAAGLAPGLDVDLVMCFSGGEVALAGRGRVRRLCEWSDASGGKAEISVRWAPEHASLVEWLKARAEVLVEAQEAPPPITEELSRDLGPPPLGRAMEPLASSSGEAQSASDAAPVSEPAAPVSAAPGVLGSERSAPFSEPAAPVARTGGSEPATPEALALGEGFDEPLVPEGFVVMRPPPAAPRTAVTDLHRTSLDLLDREAIRAGFSSVARESDRAQSGAWADDLARPAGFSSASASPPPVPGPAAPSPRDGLMLPQLTPSVSWAALTPDTLPLRAPPARPRLDPPPRVVLGPSTPELAFPALPPAGAEDASEMETFDGRLNLAALAAVSGAQRLETPVASAEPAAQATRFDEASPARLAMAPALVAPAAPGVDRRPLDARTGPAPSALGALEDEPTLAGGIRARRLPAPTPSTSDEEALPELGIDEVEEVVEEVEALEARAEAERLRAVEPAESSEAELHAEASALDGDEPLFASDVPPHEFASQELAPQEFASQELAPQEFASQELAPQEFASQELAEPLAGGALELAPEVALETGGPAFAAPAFDPRAPAVASKFSESPAPVDKGGRAPEPRAGSIDIIPPSVDLIPLPWNEPRPLDEPPPLVLDPTPIDEPLDAEPASFAEPLSPIARPPVAPMFDAAASPSADLLPPPSSFSAASGSGRTPSATARGVSSATRSSSSPAPLEVEDAPAEGCTPAPGEVSNTAYVRIGRGAGPEPRRGSNAGSVMEIEEVTSGTPEPIEWNPHQGAVDWERQSGEVTPLARIGLVRETERSRGNRSAFGSNTNASFEALPGKKEPRVLPAKSRLVIGIDLGTTHTSAAVGAENGARVIPSRRGTNAIPSVVLIHPEGKTIVGEPALRRLPLFLRQTITGMNPLMGRPYHSPLVQKQVGRAHYDLTEGDEGEAAVRIGGVKISFEELSSLLLKEIREGASLSLEDKVTRAVLTCPPYFTGRQRQAMRVAGELAGLHVERLLLEPLAVAIAFGLSRAHGIRRALVVDAGGGSFDATLVLSDHGALSVQATVSDPSLGGMRFDACLVDLVLQYVMERHHLDARGDPTALARLLPPAEKAKRELSTHPTAKVVVEDFVVHDGPPLSFEVALSREQVERRVESLVTRMIRVCRDLLAQLGGESLDDFILVGGQSRMPIVERALTHGLGGAPRRDVDPEEAAAIGAALCAQAIETPHPYVVLESLTASIGVGLPGGRLQKIVERGTRLPLRREHRLVTSRDNQPTIELALFQGEHDDVWSDELLGLLRVTGLSPATAGRDSVRLVLSVNQDHVLSFSAVEEGTGRELEAALVTRLSPDEVRSKLGAAAPRTPSTSDGAGLAIAAESGEGGLWKWIRRTLS